MAPMEQNVAKAKGLTPRQKQFLELVLKEPYILKNFYLSGGTALSSWYLHHRESFDLDFFTQFRPFDSDKIIAWLKAGQESIGYRTVHIDEDFVFLTVTFRYPEDTFLKIDFTRYTKKRFKKGIMWRGLDIDSIYDIAVNKVDTIASAPRARDYVDLYCILKKKSFPLRHLIHDAENKFSEQIDPLQLAKNFLKAVEYSDIPKMLVPFVQNDMNRFFMDLARSLKKDIFI